MSIDVISVSSKGQVVIPAEFRKTLEIKSGDKLAAYLAGDVIMLKRIEMPTEKDFSLRLDEAAAWADSVGYQESDINEIIKDVRQKNVNDSYRHKCGHLCCVFGGNPRRIVEL